MSKAEATDGREPGRRGNMLSGLAVGIGCALFLGGFVWGAVSYQPYTVPTRSMDPTVSAGSRVLAERIDGHEVRRGDVVVFEASVWGDLPMLKRVVGVGGDEIACCDERGRLTLDGKPVEEPYLQGDGPASSTQFRETVPKGRLFLLGDQRQGSQDSRVHLQDADHGAVPRSSVTARVDATAWPLESWGMVARPSGFAGLPGGVSEPGPLRLLVIMIGMGAVLILGGAAHGPLARRAERRAHDRRS